jgi:hypothetical protein
LDQYNKKEALLDNIATDLKALGADVDDRTWTQKMAAFGKALESGNFFELVTLGSEGGKAVKEVYDIASGIKDIVQNIASMV